VFGTLLHGTEENPAVTKESVHHFSKLVSGAPIKRPAWFFDVRQQGEGLVDITTHLVDLVQWESFPGEILEFPRDIRILSARRWPTEITPAQFERVTQLQTFPAYLRDDVQANGNLHTYANGEINYKIKGVHAKVSVLWNFEAPEGAGDTHFSVMRGSKANLVIRQGAAEDWQPVLTIEPATAAGAASFDRRGMRNVSRRRLEACGRCMAGRNSGGLSCGPRSALCSSRHAIPGLCGGGRLARLGGPQHDRQVSHHYPGARIRAW
jgi:predicted dehydrogenase